MRFWNWLWEREQDGYEGQFTGDWDAHDRARREEKVRAENIEVGLRAETAELRRRIDEMLDGLKPMRENNKTLEKIANRLRAELGEEKAQYAALEKRYQIVLDDNTKQRTITRELRNDLADYMNGVKPLPILVKGQLRLNPAPVRTRKAKKP
jgi:chromosome segregation ATPase